jgi:lysophospholipase L1-like esterase
LLTALLSRFVQESSAAGARPVLLLIPTRLEHFDGSTEATLEQRVVPFACNLGMTTVVLSTAFRAEQTRVPQVPLFRPREDGGHFSVAGHRLAAEILAAHLTAEGNRDCSRHRKSPHPP